MERRPFVVTVNLSRVQRCTVAIEVDAENRSTAESLGRAMAREAMDGRRHLRSFANTATWWTVDEARAFLATEVQPELSAHAHRNVTEGGPHGLDIT